MKKVLILGDYKKCTWHPFKGVDERLVDILSDYETTLCADYTRLTLSELQQYDFIVDYIDGWQSTGNCELSGALIGYVAGGGAVLGLHNGIICHSSPEMEQFFGAAFTGHPAQRVLNYSFTGSHPMISGLKPFAMDEEPYQFTISNLARLNALLEFELDGQKYPAAWLRGFGRGKVVYLSPGHMAASFDNEGFRALIKRAALWCADDLLKWY